MAKLAFTSENSLKIEKNKCKLLDLGSVGPQSTWKGPRCGLFERMFVRLDRALYNDKWRVTFPNAFVKVLPHIDFSDHHPLLLCLHSNANDRRERPFRFESAWLTHQTFKADMQGWWNKDNDLDCNLKKTEQELRS